MPAESPDTEAVALKPLLFNETSFDRMSRGELVRHCQRLYEATSALMGHRQRAREKGVIALELARDGHDADDLYHSFYRYTGALLFGPSMEGIRDHNWAVCDKCTQYLAPGGSDGPGYAGKRHVEIHPGHSCEGTMRELTWEDMMVRPPREPATPA